LEAVSLFGAARRSLISDIKRDGKNYSKRVAFVGTLHNVFYSKNMPFTPRGWDAALG
jgi:hypothetical protein